MMLTKVKERRKTDPSADFERRAAELLARLQAPELRRDHQRGLEALRQRGIRTFDDLAAALPKLKGSVAGTGLHLVMAFGRARAVPALLPLLEWGSAGALAELGGARACAGCVAVLRGDAPARVRAEAAYALTFMHDTRAAPALIDCVRDPAEAPEVRGQAAEGLAVAGMAARQRFYGTAARAALAGLADSSPTVRFWCASALGKMRYRPALRALRRVAEDDDGLCPGWWRVGDEASDAIAWIEGRPPRDPGPSGAPLDYRPTAFSRAFSQAALDLGIEFVSPYTIPGAPISISGWLPHFGNERGTAIIAPEDPDRAFDAADEAGLYRSALSSHFYSRYWRETFIETLSDWRWWGPSEKRPFWLEPTPG